MFDTFVLMERGTEITVPFSDGTINKIITRIRAAIKPPFNVKMDGWRDGNIISRWRCIDDKDLAQSFAALYEDKAVTKITFDLDPNQFDMWIDVSERQTQPIPRGTLFFWAGVGIDGNLVGSTSLVDSLPPQAKWAGFNNDHNCAHRATHIYLPSKPTMVSPPHPGRISTEKADPKTSSQTDSEKPEAKVQSDDKQHLSEADLRELGVPNSLFKSTHKCPACGHMGVSHELECPINIVTRVVAAYVTMNQSAGSAQTANFSGDLASKKSGDAPILLTRGEAIRPFTAKLHPHQEQFQNRMQRARALRDEETRIGKQIQTLEHELARIQIELLGLKLGLNSNY